MKDLKVVGNNAEFNENHFKIENGQPFVSSLYIAEVTGKAHDKVTRDIENILKEVDNDFSIANFGESNYISNRGKIYMMYWLSEDGSSVLLGGYSIAHRVKIQKELRALKEQQKHQQNQYKLPTNYKEALLALVAAEEEKEKLVLQIQEVSKESNFRGEVIRGMTDDISIADKRQILNRVVRYANANYSERWRELYKQFEMKYHINITARVDNYNANITVKSRRKSKIDYIDTELNMIPELYEIACKLYASDVDSLVKEMYGLR